MGATLQEVSGDDLGARRLARTPCEREPSKDRTSATKHEERDRDALRRLAIIVVLLEAFQVPNVARNGSWVEPLGFTVTVHPAATFRLLRAAVPFARVR